jgi:hypothetical protein
MLATKEILSDFELLSFHCFMSDDKNEMPNSLQYS